MLVLKNLIVVAQFLSALGIIGLVLLQRGKGADMGAAFGSGSSGSLFGATGAANFLSRTTAILAVIFFVSTLSLTFIGSQNLNPQRAYWKVSSHPYQLGRIRAKLLCRRQVRQRQVKMCQSEIKVKVKKTIG